MIWLCQLGHYYFFTIYIYNSVNDRWILCGTDNLNKWILCGIDNLNKWILCGIR